MPIYVVLYQDMPYFAFSDEAACRAYLQERHASHMQTGRMTKHGDMISFAFTVFEFNDGETFALGDGTLDKRNCNPIDVTKFMAGERPWQTWYGYRSDKPGN